MPLFRHVRGCAKAFLICSALLTGCSTAAKQSPLAVHQPASLCGPLAEAATEARAPNGKSGESRNSTTFQHVNHEIVSDDPVTVPADGADLFTGQAELDLAFLEEQVQARNPSLQAALAVWGAAAEKTSQASALDDPMLQTMAAPGTFASNSSTQSSYVVGVGQKLPWFGKRGLRGQVAQWNSVAASFDHGDVKLRLAEAARLAFYDYYYVFQQAELNKANLEAVTSYHDTARSKFEANQVSQQDMLQATVELARIEQMQVEIERARVVAVARINQLLHRDPQLPVPPAVRQLPMDFELDDADVLRERALQQRPDIAALAARLHAEQNALALVCKEYYPDFEIMGKYDSFWTDVVQRGQVALNLNIPLNQSRRGAAVREAVFNLSKMKADYDQQVDAVKNEVQTAHARL
ncbi:MAG: TolC family protein, partial [Planctomycetes bacterium]|nr:TolC family protein [Planctomycetota bacterium]